MYFTNKKDLPVRTIITDKNKNKEVRMDKFKLKLLMPIKSTSSFDYVLANDIYRACKLNNLCYEKFQDWMVGQTLPVVEYEAENMYNCYYVSDVEYWFKSVIYKRKEPIIRD